MKMIKNKTALIAMCTSLFAVGAGIGFSSGNVVDTVAEENKKNITIKLNGGFQVTDTDVDNPTYSETDVTANVQVDENGKFVFTHENVRAMFNNQPVYYKSTAACDIPFGYQKITNTIAYDATTGYYNPTSAEGTLPWMLFGVFEDKDGDGVLDSDETLYRSGDTIDLTNVETLTCYYNTNVYYCTLQTVKDDQNTKVALQKAWRYENTSDMKILDGENGNPVTVITAQDLQPFYHELSELYIYSFWTSQSGGQRGIEELEIPNTVTCINGNALRQLTSLKVLKGLENVDNLGVRALYTIGNNTNETVRMTFENLKTAYSSTFVIGNGKNVSYRYIFAGNTSNTLFNSALSLKLFYDGGDGSRKSLTNPVAYAYVPYGETETWYPSAENVQNSCFYTVYDATNTVTQHNIPVREAYKVSFNLSGGTIEGETSVASTYMDAGARSVKYSEREYNLTWTDATTGLQMTTNNPAAQDLSLLPAENPGLPVRENYSFAGWKDQFGNVWSAEDLANGGRAGAYETKEIVLTAQWAAKISVTYKYNNGQSDEIIDSYSGALVEEKIPENKAHHVFTGWYKDEACTQKWDFDSDTLTEDTILYAGWSASSYVAELHVNGGTLSGENITEGEDGTYQFSFTYSDETAYNLPTPTRDNYDFVGWYKEADLLGEKVTQIPVNSSGGLVYYAKWELQTTAYAITYQLNGGINNDANPDTYISGTAVTLAVATKEGHDFDGWYKEDSFTTKVEVISATQTGAITLHAKFTPATYTIIYYNVDGATNGNPDSYTYGNLITLAQATKEGFTFDGWFTNSACTQPIDKITASTFGNLELYAKFTEIPEEETIYTITYHNVEGINNPNTATQYVENSVVTFVDVSKEGYVFYGWYLDAAYVTRAVSTEGRAENLDLYAKWKAVISYELGGGVNADSNPTEYTEGTAVALENASKEGYTFEGWYTDASFTTKITEISADSTGPITLYAKFAEIEQPDDGNSENTQTPDTGDNNNNTQTPDGNTEEKSGCGSILGGEMAFVGLGLAAIVVAKRKKND